MRYLVMVSHGTFAPGLHSVLKMLAGERENVLSCSLEDGMGVDEFRARLDQVLAPVAAGDEIVLLADIIGGSPLTNALNLLHDRGLLAHTVAFGGMNLPMAMTAFMGLDAQDLEGLKRGMLDEAHAGAAEFAVAADGGDEEDEEV